MLDSFRNSLITVITRKQTDDMTVRQLCILTCVANAPRTVRDIAVETKLAKPSISRAGDRLKEFGFITRKDDPNDRRSVLFALTNLGKRFLTSVEAG